MNKYKISCADTEEDVEDCFSQMSASPVIQTGDNSYLYFLDMEIGKSSQYRNLISFLRTADEDDTLDMIICNDGGELFTTLNVCEEILNSPVTVRASVRGRCCSGATAPTPQNCTPDEVMSLVTRIGEGSFLYITGDKKQNDLKGKITGIEYLQKLITKYSVAGTLDEASVHQFVSNTGIVEFTNDDVVRSGLTSAFVKAFNKEGI